MKGLVGLIVGLAVAVSLGDGLSPEFKDVAETVHREMVSAHRSRLAFQERPADTNLLAEAERCYQRALAFSPVLQHIPVGQCGEWLEKGTAPDACRPTLYDAVVYDLLDFYAFVMESGANGDDAAVMDADGPALDDAEKFRVEIPADVVRQSRMMRALRLYQMLLEFHEMEKDQSAYADADLNRLLFCRRFASGASRETRFTAALDRFAYKWRKHEVSARATAFRAARARERGDAAFARMLAQNGAATFPGSIGAAQCRNLVAEIEAPSLEVYASAVWCPPWPEITVMYKNLPQLTFRAVRLEERDRSFGRLQGTDGKLGGIIAKMLLKRPPAKGWVMALPPAPDYREREYSVTVPKDLAVGRYAVFASADGRFAEDGAPTLFGVCDVSDADGSGARHENIRSGLTPLFGAWTRVPEPDEWSYRAWRGTDGSALRHR